MANNKNIETLENRIDELEQEKQQLLKLVSHDVKSPFNKLFALSSLLQLTADNLTVEQLDYLNRMEWAIKEGLTVVRNLLDLRAIENGDIELQMEELEINPIISDSIKNYLKQSEAKNIYFDLKIEEMTAWSDKRLLERIVDNMVSNAIKFTPKASTIYIELGKQHKGIFLKISSESGPILNEETAQLFKRNSPLSTRPTHGESALGNGLYIAQNYAQLLNGKISFLQKDLMISFSLDLTQSLNA